MMNSIFGFRAFILLIFALSFIEYSVAIAAPSELNCAAESLSQILLNASEHSKALAALKPTQKEHIEKAIAPILGPLLFKTGKAKFRPCSGDGSCLLFSGHPNEKLLELKWDSNISKPEIYASQTTRTLVIPEKMSTAELAESAGPLVQQWTMGHSLHPFIYDAQTARELSELGISKLTLRPAQKEAILAGQKAFDEGHRSFLYVAPTGTGKTEVLTRVLEHEIKSPRNRNKFHVMVAHQLELVEQFARELAPLEPSGKIKIVRKFSLDEMLRSPQEPPQVYVFTIQSLVDSVQKLDPEQLKALRSKLSTFVFDESHHLGAPTYLKVVRDLVVENKEARLLGATATPIHRDQGIQALFNESFEGKSFWAYLDHAKEGGGIERTTSAVVDQLDSAIKAGELAPLEHFYVLDPNSFEPALKSESSSRNIFVRKDPGNTKSAFQIDPEKYSTLTKRLSPLFDRHSSGFVAANSIAEAERLKAVFEKAMPTKKFVLYHGELSEAARSQIQSRIYGGEDLFLITVNLLDEGVNFPKMSLYIDLNRTLGVRQLLQRWGRVARLAPGKEGVEIATLTNWQDAEFIKDKISLIEKFSESDKQGSAFKGSIKEGRGGTDFSHSRRAALDVEGLVPIDAETKQKELMTLRNQMREIFAAQEVKQSPLERLNQRIKEGKGLPSVKEDNGAYHFYSKLSPEPATWPLEMSEELKTAIVEYQKTKRVLGSPLDRLNQRIKEGKGLPSVKEDGSAYNFLQKFSRDPATWLEGVSPELKAAVLEYQKTKFAKVSPLERLNQRIKEGKGLPSQKEDSGAYQFYCSLSSDPVTWPEGLSEELKTAIVEYQKTKRVLGSPLDRLNQRIKEGKGLPSQKEDNGAYQFYFKLSPDAATWPEEMNSELKAAIVEYQKTKFAKVSPLERLNHRIKEGKGLPSPKEDSGAYQFYFKLSPDAATWPEEMNSELKAAIVEYQKTKFAKVSPLERLNQRIKEGKGLPSPKEDNGAYQFYLKLSPDPATWPEEMTPELKAAILEYKSKNKKPK